MTSKGYQIGIYLIHKIPASNRDSQHKGFDPFRFCFILNKSTYSTILCYLYYLVQNTEEKSNLMFYVCLVVFLIPNIQVHFHCGVHYSSWYRQIQPNIIFSLEKKNIFYPSELILKVWNSIEHCLFSTNAPDSLLVSIDYRRT